jgi:steroid Delta-isomerase
MSSHHLSIAAYAAAIGSLSADAFAACFAEGCELNEPVGAPPVHGQEGAKAFYNGIAPLISKIEFRPGTIHVGGDRAAFGWTIEAEGKNGKTATAEGIDVMEFDAGGKILRSWAYWDPGPFVGALMA